MRGGADGAHEGEMALSRRLPVERGHVHIAVAHGRLDRTQAGELAGGQCEGIRGGILFEASDAPGARDGQGRGRSCCYA
jgi:hypothetical protein